MPRRTSLRLESLEAHETPSANRLFAISQDGGSRVIVYEAMGAVAESFQPSRDFSTGLFTPVYSGSGRLLKSFDPYANGFSGGVRVSLGDVTGDGIEDLVTAPGSGGGPHIKVYDGAALLDGRLTLVREFMAFDPNFRGGVYVAIGQVDPSTGGQEIVVSAGTGGGPHVRVFGLNSNTPVRDFFAFDSEFRGGVRVASADMNGDGRSEVIVGAGPGSGPQVKVFDLSNARPIVIDQFYAYDRTFRGGVYVAAGAIEGYNKPPDIVTGAGEGGGPHVKVWNRANGMSHFTAKYDFFAGDSNSRAGIRVSVGNLGKLTDRQSLYVADGDGPRGQANSFNIADPRLRSYNLTQFITMMADGYPTPPADQLLGFTETGIDLFDGFANSRIGGLNIG